MVHSDQPKEPHQGSLHTNFHRNRSIGCRVRAFSSEAPLACLPAQASQGNDIPLPIVLRAICWLRRVFFSQLFLTWWKFSKCLELMGRSWSTSPNHVVYFVPLTKSRCLFCPPHKIMLFILSPSQNHVVYLQFFVFLPNFWVFFIIKTPPKVDFA